MERPKTYGEFAEMNEYTCVDERLRDREISDITQVSYKWGAVSHKYVTIDVFRKRQRIEPLDSGS